jgi:hypothetical protein
VPAIKETATVRGLRPSLASYGRDAALVPGSGVPSQVRRSPTPESRLPRRFTVAAGRAILTVKASDSGDSGKCHIASHTAQLCPYGILD